MNKEKVNWEGLGKNWSIDNKCFSTILEILPKGKTILELGSGFGSNELGKYYNIYCVEHDKYWNNKYDNINYIYAPLKPLKDHSDIMWYDIDVLKNDLPNNYDLILIDGPPGNSSKNNDGRMGFTYNIDLFNIVDKFIIFDDLNRKKDYDNMMLFINKTNRMFKIIDSKDNTKKFGVVYP
ncbi:MAG: hypothetical protein ACOC3V_01380 [bacterium]